MKRKIMKVEKGWNREEGGAQTTHVCVVHDSYPTI